MILFLSHIPKAETGPPTRRNRKPLPTHRQNRFGPKLNSVIRPTYLLFARSGPQVNQSIYHMGCFRFTVCTCPHSVWYLGSHTTTWAQWRLAVGVLLQHNRMHECISATMGPPSFIVWLSGPWVVSCFAWIQLFSFVSHRVPALVLKEDQLSFRWFPSVTS